MPWMENSDKKLYFFYKILFSWSSIKKKLQTYRFKDYKKVLKSINLKYSKWKGVKMLNYVLKDSNSY